MIVVHHGSTGEAGEKYLYICNLCSVHAMQWKGCVVLYKYQTRFGIGGFQWKIDSGRNSTVYDGQGEEGDDRGRANEQGLGVRDGVVYIIHTTQWKK